MRKKLSLSTPTELSVAGRAVLMAIYSLAPKERGNIAAFAIGAQKPTRRSIENHIKKGATKVSNQRMVDELTALDNSGYIKTDNIGLGGSSGISTNKSTEFFQITNKGKLALSPETPSQTHVPQSQKNSR